MKYPVAAEQIEKEYEEVNGCKLPDSRHDLLTNFTNLLNSAYQSGFEAGKAHIKGAA